MSPEWISQCSSGMLHALGRAGQSFPLSTTNPSSCMATVLPCCTSSGVPCSEGRCLQQDLGLCWPWKHRLLCGTWRTGITGWLQQGRAAKSNSALWSPISVYPNVWDELESQWINRLELKARQVLFFLFCTAFCTRIQLRRAAFLLVQECRHVAKMDFCLCAACMNLWVLQVFMALQAHGNELCYLGMAQSRRMDPVPALGSLSQESAFDESSGWREQGRSEAFCTNTSRWEQPSHHNCKNHSGFLMKKQNKNDLWRDKGRFVCFLPTIWWQPPMLLCHYSFLTQDSLQENEMLLSPSTLLQWAAVILLLGENLSIEWSSVAMGNCQCTA